ncbi:unnamed protein product [Hymenolepis diminuta]|uniref:Uncharacterized protein n=1 Tax=Hymenolepis diminuta TaxID=6216 RepID=A0A564YVW6_HYMDI|nr:unnamed protein product [Hymenolepis diminuta]
MSLLPSLFKQVAWKLFPKGLILGDAPPTLKKNTSGKKKMRNSNSTSRLSSAATICSPSFRSSAYDDGASSVYASSIGGRSVTSSVRRAIRYTYDTYDSVGTRGTPSGGEEFSMMDLAHLQLTLNSLFAAGRANSTASSRVSTKASLCSRASCISTLRKMK